MKMCSSGMMVLAIAVALVCAGVVQASVTPTDNIAFSDDFDDNGNGWTEHPATNMAIGTDPGPTSESVLYPMVDSDNNDVAVYLEGPTGPLDISKGAISVYVRVRVDDINNADANRFSFGLEEDGSHYGVNLEIRPGAATKLWRRVGGVNTGANIAGFTFPDTTSFVDFKLTLTDNGNGTMTAEGFKKISTDLDFVSLGSVADAQLITGIFGSADQGDPGLLQFYMRNASGTNNRAYFDSIAIQEPPPKGTVVSVR